MVSSPSVVALDNQPALLKVGDEVPISTSTPTVLTECRYAHRHYDQIRNTGVILKVMPHVNASGSSPGHRAGDLRRRQPGPADADTDDLAAARPFHRLGDERADRAARGPDQRARAETRSGVPVFVSRSLGDLFGNTTGTK